MGCPISTSVRILNACSLAVKASGKFAVVQYASDDDYLSASSIAEAFNYKLIKSPYIDALETYDPWIVVGAQLANPVYAQVFGPLITLNDEGFIRIDYRDYSYGGKQISVWGVAGYLAQDTQLGAQWIVANGLPAGPMKTPWVVVQYASDDDYSTASMLAGARGWELGKTSDMSSLRAYDGWVLVGAQLANPVCNDVFGPLISENDEGYIRVAYRVYGYVGRSRQVWGIASWSASDTRASAEWVMQYGLPSNPVRHRR